MSSEVTPSLLVVMAGYAKDNHLRPVSERWLHALRAISSKLVLVYDQDQLKGVPTSYQNSDDVEIVVTRHGAYDFGSYQRGLAIAEQRRWLDGVSHILLCNDSVIGPFGSLDAFVRPMLESGDPLWGVTDSNLYRPHLQSYFLLMRRDLYQVHSIQSFFGNIAPQKSRHDVIQAYELGFSGLICELGIQWRVFLSSDDMRDPRNGASMGNITAYPLCMLQKGAPVIKVKALTDPRSNFDGLAKTCAHLSRHYPDLWRELWSSSELQPMWQSSLPVAVVLGQDDLSCLEERLDWIRLHPHRNLKAVIDI